MSDAINTEALIATVCEIVDRAEKLLAVRGESANPSVSDELFELGREIQDLSWEFAHAASALHVLSELAWRLGRRAIAYAEVYGTSRPSEDDFAVVTNVGLTHFGLGGTHTPSDEDVPF